MPTPALKSFADQSGKSMSEVERLWDEAKKAAAEQGHKEDYDYITGIVKKMLSIESVSFEQVDKLIEEVVATYFTLSEDTQSLIADLRKAIGSKSSYNKDGISLTPMANSMSKGKAVVRVSIDPESLNKKYPNIDLRTTDHANAFIKQFVGYSPMCRKNPSGIYQATLSVRDVKEATLAEKEPKDTSVYTITVLNTYADATDNGYTRGTAKETQATGMYNAYMMVLKLMDKYGEDARIIVTWDEEDDMTMFDTNELRSNNPQAEMRKIINNYKSAYNI
jgi:hypothetical protein